MGNNYQNYINTNIKYLRDKNKIQQGKMAEDLDIDQSTIAKWESGDRQPNMDWILKLCSYFNVFIADFITKDLRFENEPSLNENEDIQEYNFGDVKVTLSKGGKITDEDFTEINKFLLQQKMLNESKKDN